MIKTKKFWLRENEAAIPSHKSYRNTKLWVKQNSGKFVPSSGNVVQNGGND